MPEQDETTGGINYSKIVKPLTENSFLGVLCMETFAESIVSASTHFSLIDPEHVDWVRDFAVLACDYISNCADKLPRSGQRRMDKAAGILSNFLLGQMREIVMKETVDYAVLERMAAGIVALASKDSDTMDPKMKEELIKRVDAGPVPSWIHEDASKDDHDEEDAEFQPTPDSPGFAADMMRPQTDLTGSLIHQMINPDNRYGASLDTQVQQQVWLGQLRRQAAPNLIIETLYSLPHLTSFIHKWQDMIMEEGTRPLPLSGGEATRICSHLSEIASEIGFATSLIQLPLYQNSDFERIQKLSVVALGSLLAALTVAAALPRDAPPTESLAAKKVVENSIKLASWVVQVARRSSRLGAATASNLTASCAWLLFTAIEASHGTDFKKVESNFSSLTVSLTSFALTLLSELLADVNEDESTIIPTLTSGSAGSGGGRSPKIEPANFNLAKPFTSIQRVILIFSSLPIYSFLLRLSQVSFWRCRELASMDVSQFGTKKSDLSSASSSFDIGGGPSDVNDSTVSNTGREEDEESLVFGKWMHTMMQLDPLSEARSSSQMSSRSNSMAEGHGQNHHPSSSESSNISNLGSGLPGAKLDYHEEPGSYLLLSSQILTWLSAQIATSLTMAEDETPSWLVEFSKQAIDANFIETMGNFIKDVDENHEGSSSANTLISSGFLGKCNINMWNEFTSSLFGFTRTIITHISSKPDQSEGLAIHLLTNLCLDPTQDKSVPWPLNVPARRLSVLAQVLLASQKDNTDAYSTKVTGQYVLIWERAINTMASIALKSAASSGDKSGAFSEDIKVENMQLLLLLFHALLLLQKKQVVLNTANKLAEVCHKKPLHPSPVYCLMLTRLALLLDYMIRHLYEPPPTLLPQIRNNLFEVSSASSKPSYYTLPEFEDAQPLNGEGGVSPMFYLLSPLSQNADNAAMEVPKLDGLAVSFLLTTPEGIDYPGLYESLINVLDVMYAGSSHAGGGVAGVGSVVGYCFTIIWRLVNSLPPPAPFLAKLVSIAERKNEEEKVGYGLSLFALILGLRPTNKAFFNWMKESLTLKQGLSQVKAESLLKSIVTELNSIGFIVQLLKGFLLTVEERQAATSAVSANSRYELNLADLLLLDCLIAKFRIAINQILTSSKLGGAINSSLETLISGSFTELSDHEALRSTASAPAASGSAPEWPACGSMPQAMEAAQQLVPTVARLVTHLSQSAKSLILDQHNQSMKKKDGGQDLCKHLPTYMHSLCLAGRQCDATSDLAAKIASHLPHSLTTAIMDWSSASITKYPLDSGWANVREKGIIPGESYLYILIEEHASLLQTIDDPGATSPKSENGITTYVHPPASALKHVLFSAARLACDLLVWCPESGPQKKRLIACTLSLILDVSSEFMTDLISFTLERHIGPVDGDKSLAHVYQLVLQHGYPILIDRHDTGSATVQSPTTTEKNIPLEIIKFMDQMLDTSVGCQAIVNFFAASSSAEDASTGASAANKSGASLTEILLTISSPDLPLGYSSATLHFFNKLFAAAASASEGQKEGLVGLCRQMSALLDIPRSRLEEWLRYLVIGIYERARGSSPNNSNNSVDSELMNEANENRNMLQSITGYIVKEESGVPEDVPLTILYFLAPIATELLSSSYSQGTQKGGSSKAAVGFPDLMSVMSGLATAGGGQGHLTLFQAAIEWLDTVKKYMVQKNVVEKLEEGVSSGRHVVMLDNLANLLNYITNMLIALKFACGRWGLPSAAASAAAAVSGATDQQSTPSANASGGKSLVDVMDDMWLDDVLEGIHPVGLSVNNAQGVLMSGEESEDDDGNEEDGETSLLDSKLCTFTQTARVFMNQHWYHCHTCGLVERDGCCSICARVCHRDHDVTYSKHGSFFCDCGARENDACDALQPRNSNGSGAAAPSTAAKSREGFFGSSSKSTDSGSRRRRHGAESRQRVDPNASNGSDGASSGPGVSKAVITDAQIALARSIDPHREALVAILETSQCLTNLLEMAEAFAPVLESPARFAASPLFAMSRMRKALLTLHEEPPNRKQLEWNESLVLPTLGSQEGAFENVKMNFSGDQGQTIRQLLSAHMIRRGIMCCLSSPGGKRQHLAVSHEKGKITVLQLSALLKQADTSQKKLTLTRLASAPVPFTVLSMLANPVNDNFLAVCGLKDARVLTFNATTGGVTEQLVLQPQLESVNYIIRPLWLPESQTQLALVTADYVKIYDLAEDSLSPTYYLIIPCGKIRDATFIHTPTGDMYLVLMSSIGHIYFQQLCDESSARHGTFYVTNIMEVSHPEITDVNGNLGGGGVSVYYSHTLQMLFFSYSQGISFMAPIRGTVTEELYNLFHLNLRPLLLNGALSSVGSKNGNGGSSSSAGSGGSGSSNGGGGNMSTQPLCGWNEVSGHPGLVTAVLQQAGNPIIFMIEPKCVMVQEVRVGGTKSKIMDMVAIRHASSAGSGSNGSTGGGEEKTTMILLCEDGSLKIYMAGAEITNYWLQPHRQPANGSLVALGLRSPSQLESKNETANSKARGAASCRSSSIAASGGPVGFPVDFFEHCQEKISDIEFGGADVLQVYNVAQVRQRLQSMGQYLANTKSGGFQLEVTCHDQDSVIVGLRFHLGSQDTLRVPSTIELFGRTVHVNMHARGSGIREYPRWFEFPLTREETIQCGGHRLTINFGPSMDPTGISFVDSVQVWTKTKEAFGGWPEDNDEFSGTAPGAPGASTSDLGNVDEMSAAALALTGTAGASTGMNAAITSMDRVIVSTLESLESSLSLLSASPYNTLTSASDAESTSPLQSALAVATRLLMVAGPDPGAERATRAVLYSVHTSQQACHLHIDTALLWRAASLLTGEDSQLLDVERFHLLLGTSHSIAMARPKNLINFAENMDRIKFENGISMPTSPSSTTTPDDGQDKKSYKSRQCQEFINLLVSAFWRLLEATPANVGSGGLGQPGLTFVEITVQYLVDILHAFTFADIDTANFAADHYIRFLLCPDTRVAFPARAAIVRNIKPRQRRKKAATGSGGSSSMQSSSQKQSEKQSSETGSVQQAGSSDASERPSAPAPPSRGSSTTSGRRRVSERRPPGHPPVGFEGENDEDEDDLQHDLRHGPGGMQLGGVAGNLDALLPTLAGGGAVSADNLQEAMLGLPSDEAMVELAIALSLQEQEGGGAEVGALAHGLQGLQQLANLGQGLAGILGASNDQDSEEEDVVEVEDDDDEDDEEDDDAHHVVGDMSGQEENGRPGNDRRQDQPESHGQEALSGGGTSGSGGDDPAQFSDTTASVQGSDDDEDDIDETFEEDDIRVVRRDASDSANTSSVDAGLGEAGGSAQGASDSASRGTDVHGAVAGDNSLSLDGNPGSSSLDQEAGGSDGAAKRPGGDNPSGELVDSRLAGLRQILMERLVVSLHRLRHVGGSRCIPYMQLILALATNLDLEDARDKAILISLMKKLVHEMGLNDEEKPEGTAANNEKSAETASAESKDAERDEDEEADGKGPAERSRKREFHLVIMRLLSVLMSRSGRHSTTSSAAAVAKSSSTTQPSSSSLPGTSASVASSSRSSSHQSPQHMSSSVASFLAEAGLHGHCLTILKSILPYWQSLPVEDATTSSSSTGQSPNGAAVNGGSNSGNFGGSFLLKPVPTTPAPDMAPFFLKQYVKTHANDIFQLYPQLLTEMALRIPYQMKKMSDNGTEPAPHFQQDWFFQLCELMMTPQAPFVKRQVRKLLMLICGSKEQYRQLRDLHTLETKIREIKIIVAKGGYDFSELDGGSINLQYDSLIQLIEQLKTCVEVAESRTLNWQKFCVSDETVLPFLLQISFLVDNGVAPFILQLLQSALCAPSTNRDARYRSKSSSPVKTVAESSSVGSSKRSTRSQEKLRSEEPEDAASETGAVGCASDEKLCLALAQQVCTHVFPRTNQDLANSALAKFIEKFLLECNTTSIRWQAHGLVVSLNTYSTEDGKRLLLDILWELWGSLPHHGRRSAQFVDLLGYFSVMVCRPDSDSLMAKYACMAVNMLRSQNQILASHPNSSIYSWLSQLVDFSGFYLESDPCLVCNNPEVAFSTIKLANLKVDTKYTTSTQMVKLNGSHSISKITLRIGDLKRQKMVRTIHIYYNNRSVQAVVDLKNRPTVWLLAKRITLTAGQTDIRVEFPLPIVACNIMILYSDFYENIQAVGESLQCPRCSASVPANPGVCSNCGENVFQCHKCRTINYDEKDPFLCNSCGFCKYAKFEYSLTARPCSAVDPIESEEDRNKALASINSLLEKADKVYRQLISYKPELEDLLWRIQEGGSTCGSTGAVKKDTPGDQQVAAGQPAMASPVNRYIHQLGEKYCVDCKNVFEELSGLIQKVMATRLELLAYDRSLQTQGSQDGQGGAIGAPGGAERKLSATIDSMQGGISSTPTCYGCASASVEHCLTLLRALATKKLTRAHLHNQGLVVEMLNHNLRRGSAQTRLAVQSLICLLTRNNQEATNHLNNVLYTKISSVLSNNMGNEQLLLTSVRHEMTLVAAIVKQMDSAWESRLRMVVKLFLEAARRGGSSPAVMDAITLPCLNILQDVIATTQQGGAKGSADSSVKRSKSTRRSKKRHGSSTSQSKEGSEVESDASESGIPVDILAWLSGEITYKRWSKDMDKKAMMRKYFTRWRSAVEHKKWASVEANQLSGVGRGMLNNPSHLKAILFNKSSRSARQVAANLVQTFMETGPLYRRRALVDTLTSFLTEVGGAGEASQEFMTLYKKLVETPATGQSGQSGTGEDTVVWPYYLAVKGVLPLLAKLIESEISYFGRLELTRASSDLALGFAVKQLTGLLASLLQHQKIKTAYKSRLVSSVLSGYLSLRRLVIQRTKMVDETQDRLLELLEDLTTGTEEETRNFMVCCIETLSKYPPNDHLTPVFIFERLCSIIYPDEADTGEFFLSLEKDPQQEEFLQGRMLGNPYSSKEPGLGPLMREIKNKICMDCELVALLEDDNGMELLVANKIISLDLAVKDVYQKIWVPAAGEGEPMRVVYRMRGLLGDATEEFIENLDRKEGEQSDDETTYRLASVLGECGGLKVLLERLAGITSLSSKSMMTVLLKLFGYCVKLKSNRRLLLGTDMNTTVILLNTLRLCLASADASAPSAPGQPSLAETVLDLMEKLLVEASSCLQSVEEYQAFTTSSAKDINSLLDYAVHMKPGTDLHHRLLRVLPFLTYANRDNMELVINHFTDVLDFNKFDQGHTSEDEARMEAWVGLCSGIERNQLGSTMKDEFVRLGIVSRCTDYIKNNAPPNKDVLVKTDNPAWKEFSMKPSIKFILRGLMGLAKGHSQTQMTLSESCINELHLLEQISSDEHLGSLAEAVLEAVKEHEEAGNKVEKVRAATKEEKKKLAMAMRAKQLKSIGLKTNEKGQVKADTSLLQQFQAIGEESGLSCVICREGYRFQPNRVLAIYTFTKRAPLEESERGLRKSMGFSSVSHFNLVHVDCHLAAVRQARTRNEWESALLQNANTKCNGLLPLWGPEVTESAFAACLARHNTYLADVTGQRDIGYQATVQDAKLLLLKFAQEKSFSVDSGGGGPESNLHFLPYLIHTALYVINTTRAYQRELRNVESWLEAAPQAWKEQATATDGPFYQTTMACIVLPKEEWMKKRVQILQRLLMTAHLRAHQAACEGNGPSVSLTEVAEYSVYRVTALFFSLVDHMVREMWAGVPPPSKPEQDYGNALADWIRNNDETITTRSTSILNIFQEDLLPAQDLSEVIDVCGLLSEVPSPASAILEVLALLPQ